MLVKQLPRHRLLRAVLALCLLAQLGAPALGYAQACAMPGAGDHAMAMDAHGGAIAAESVMNATHATHAMDAMECCQDDGPCLMAQCMAPPGVCGAGFLPAEPTAIAVVPSPPPLSPGALPRRHFRPPIAA